MIANAMAVKTFLIALVTAGCPHYTQLKPPVQFVDDSELEDMSLTTEDSTVPAINTNLSPLTGTLALTPDGTWTTSVLSKKEQLKDYEQKIANLKLEIAQEKKCVSIETDLKRELKKELMSK